MIYLKKSTRGFTLVETVVATALVALFVIAAITFTLFIFRSEQHTVNADELHWQAQYIFETIRSIAEVSTEIDVPVMGTSDDLLILGSDIGVVEFSHNENSIYMESQNGIRLLNIPPIVVTEFEVVNVSTEAALLVQVSMVLENTSVETSTETFVSTFAVNP